MIDGLELKGCTDFQHFGFASSGVWGLRFGGRRVSRLANSLALGFHRPAAGYIHD